MKAGFVAIVGKPNVGKSTLLNRLMGQKIAPVAKVPQTTRQVLQGIFNDRDAQMVLVDTPGIHKPRDPLGQWMVSRARKSFIEADVILMLADPRDPDEDDERVLKQLAGSKKPVFLLINKTDRLRDKGLLLPIIDQYRTRFPFREIIPVSALSGDQLDLVIAKVKECLPEGERYFPEDMLSDQPVREIVKELVREKVVRLTGEEIPYETAVAVESMKTREDGLVEIQAVIFVDRESQKPILVGKGGAKIKKIGEQARRDIERFLGERVYLGLWVKVLPGWKKDPARLKRLGYQD